MIDNKDLVATCRSDSTLAVPFLYDLSHMTGFAGVYNLMLMIIGLCKLSLLTPLHLLSFPRYDGENASSGFCLLLVQPCFLLLHLEVVKECSGRLDFWERSAYVGLIESSGH